MSTHESAPLPACGHGLLKSVLSGLVILAAGAAIGASLMFLHLSNAEDRYGREPEIFAEHMLRQLGRELNLTPQQRRQLDPILRQHHKTLSDIRAGVRPQIVRQLEQLDADIAAVLTVEQAQIWQQKIRRLEEHFPTFRGPGRGQGMGPGFGPEGGRGPGIGPGFGPQPDQEFGSGLRGPQGPREPSGPGYRRQERLLRSDPNAPRSEGPPGMNF